MKKIQHDKLISSYARALFYVAEDDKESIRKEVEFLLVFFKGQRDIFMYLSNPVVSVTRKKATITCMKEYLNHKLMNFIIVICLNNRFNLLFPILERFLSFVRKDRNEFEATIKSAELLKESDIKIITESLSFLGKIVGVRNIEDPSILGGFIFRYGFYLIDASLKSYLGRLVNLTKREILE